MIETIVYLVAMLSADDFYTREQAEKTLTVINYTLNIEKELSKIKPKDIEGQRRLSRVIECRYSFYNIFALPELDFVPPSDLSVDEVKLRNKYIRKDLGNSFDEYDTRTYLFLRELTKQGTNKITIYGLIYSAKLAQINSNVKSYLTDCKNYFFGNDKFRKGE